MRFDKNKIDTLVALPDDMLWAEIVKIASGFGYALPNQTPPHAELEKIRDAARSQKINVAEALKLVNKYKKG